MPLRITDPISIRVEPFLGPGAEFVELAETNLDTQPPGAASNPLSITPVIQKESQWCWAACVEMVMAALASPHEQCEVVTNHYPGIKPEGKPCQDSHLFQDIGCAISQMDDVWKSLNVHFKLIKKVPEPGVPALAFKDLVTEINAARPLEVGISWHGGSRGHAMIVKGYGQIDSKNSVWINDPLGAETKFGHKVKAGEGKILFTELMEANGYGAWVCSWIELARI